jgi:signal peptidase I
VKLVKKGERLKRIFGLILWSIIPTIAFLIVVAYVGLTFERHVYPPAVPVEGISMNPVLHFGDLVMLKRADSGNLHVGEIIAFRTTKDVQQKWNVPGNYVHRIVAVQKGSYGLQFQTKGDNVPGKDPFWTIQQNVIGVYAGKISHGGYPILFFRSQQGRLLIAAALFIFFIYWILGVFERRRAADAVNVRNLASVVDEARRITEKLDTNLPASPAMPITQAKLRPRDWIIEGDFLTGLLSREAPDEIQAAQKIAVALDRGLGGSNWPRYEVATRAQVPIATMNAILQGEVTPDFATLAKLGKVLGLSLWI